MAAAKAVEKAVEEVVEDVVEEIATVRRIAPPRLNLNGTTKGQQIAVLGVTAFLGGVVGGVSTYLVVRKRLSAKFEARAAEQIAEAKDYYRAMAKPPVEAVLPEHDDDVLTEENVREAAEALDTYRTGQFATPEYQEKLTQVLSTADEVSDEEMIERIKEADEAADPAPDDLAKNVFDNLTKPGEAVLGALFRDRSPDKPYIITKDEYYENEGELEPRELTYYEGDGGLADEQDAPVVDIERLVGKENLLRFGYGSDDKDIVYVRNEKLQVIMEITRNEGKYAHVVAGLQQGGRLQHSADPVRKMRRGYDE